MYVVNPETIASEKLYKCKRRMGEWLLYTKDIPVFGKDKDNKHWFFAKTEELEKALKDKPFWV